MLAQYQQSLAKDLVVHAGIMVFAGYKSTDYEYLGLAKGLLGSKAKRRSDVQIAKAGELLILTEAPTLNVAVGAEDRRTAGA